jgi:hypothetical protein
MIRGLGFTLDVLLHLLREAAAESGDAGRLALAGMLERFRRDLVDQPAALPAPRPDDAVGFDALATGLRRGLAELEGRLAKLADDAVDAIGQRDQARLRAILERRETQTYLPVHDRLVRFMAESFSWVLQTLGADRLLRFHLDTAEGQRAGFEKWERLPADDFARMTAFLLKLHMGVVAVTEDDEKFVIRQEPCGSGGRLRLAGAYRGPGALPVVREAGPLSFGLSEAPIYCTHCAIWNGTATLRWFGRAQWVFDDPARADGGCVMHLYKKRNEAARAYEARVALAQGEG